MMKRKVYRVLSSRLLKRAQTVGMDRGSFHAFLKMVRNNSGKEAANVILRMTDHVEGRYKVSPNVELG